MLYAEQQRTQGSPRPHAVQRGEEKAQRVEFSLGSLSREHVNKVAVRLVWPGLGWSGLEWELPEVRGRRGSEREEQHLPFPAWASSGQGEAVSLVSAVRTWRMTISWRQ